MTEDEIPVILGTWVRGLARSESRLWHYRIPADDLSQCAFLAGILAFRRFEPGKGMCLISWLKTKMAYAVMDAVRAELQDKIGGTERLATQGMRYRMRPDMHTAVEACPDRASLQAPPEGAAIDAALDIAVALKRLNRREREVIDRRYFGDETLRSIASDIGVHFSRITQIDNAACLKMRGAFLTKAA